MSLDDARSDVSDDHATTSAYSDDRAVRDSDLFVSSVLHRDLSRDDNSMSDANYRDSYVDPLRDSSDDERTEAQSILQGSHSDETLSENGRLRPIESDTSISTALSSDAAPDPRLSFLG